MVAIYSDLSFTGDKLSGKKAQSQKHFCFLLSKAIKGTQAINKDCAQKKHRINVTFVTFFRKKKVLNNDFNMHSDI